MGHRDQVRKPLLASWLLSLAAAIPLYGVLAAAPQGTSGPPQTAPTGQIPLETRILDSEVPVRGPEAVAAGPLEDRFGPFASQGSHLLNGIKWFRIEPPGATTPGGTPVLVARSGMDQGVELWGREGGVLVPLGVTSVVPKFGGAEDKVFALPSGLDAGQPLYARVTRSGRAVTDLHFSASTLRYVLDGAAAHARAIALAFGALMAMAISALLIRLVLKDQIYPLYGAVFLLQAIYLAYFSGQGFSWPLLSWARPIANYAYNVPVAVSAAAAACWSPVPAISCSSARRSSRWWSPSSPGGAAATGRPGGS